MHDRGEVPATVIHYARNSADFSEKRSPRPKRLSFARTRRLMSGKVRFRPRFSLVQRGVGEDGSHQSPSTAAIIPPTSIRVKEEKKPLVSNRILFLHIQTISGFSLFVVCDCYCYRYMIDFLLGIL
jgi:hypothetical protein